ncbi:sulfur carrier protein ThiS [Paenibacillus sp. NPDC058071]|uniref:sulfur carrier protein ThiS n=1 Tax=Paenibacillus sp. NPDC058071 TaxID=3346326 RepID=UPI0036DD97D9
MQLTINGENRILEAKCIADIIEHFGLAGKPVIVEADGVVLRQEQWAAAETREGMVIELVQFVGGG